MRHTNARYTNLILSLDAEYKLYYKYNYNSNKLTVTALNATLQLISSTVIAIGLLLGILFIDFKVALLASLVFGSARFLASTVRRELRINGEKL